MDLMAQEGVYFALRLGVGGVPDSVVDSGSFSSILWHQHTGRKLTLFSVYLGKFCMYEFWRNHRTIERHNDQLRSFRLPNVLLLILFYHLLLFGFYACYFGYCVSLNHSYFRVFLLVYSLRLHVKWKVKSHVFSTSLRYQHFDGAAPEGRLETENVDYPWCISGRVSRGRIPALSREISYVIRDTLQEQMDILISYWTLPGLGSVMHLYVRKLIILTSPPTWNFHYAALW